MPHTYVIVGGGEWGPRVVAKALLESVYVDWEEEVYLLDMKDARAHLDTLDSGSDKKLDKVLALTKTLLRRKIILVGFVDGGCLGTAS